MAHEDFLSGQDAAFLGWESRRRPMDIGVLAVFHLSPGENQPSIDSLRRELGPRIAREPRFGDLLIRRGWPRRPAFVDGGPLCLEDHIRLGPTPAPKVTGSLAALVDRILSGGLDPSRPRWELWLLPQAEGPRTYAIVAKVHHSLLDGVAGVGVLERLLGAAEDSASLSRIAAPARTGPRRRRGLLAQGRALYRLLARVLARGPRSELTGDVTVRRHHNWLDWDGVSVEKAGARHGSTHNDALLTAVSGALHRWLARQRKDVPASVRAFCPVNLRPQGAEAGTGNQISLWLVDLPVGTVDPTQRIERVHRATSRHKRRRDAQGGAGMARLSELLGIWVSKLGMRVAAHRRAFSILVTHVPGPTRPLHLLGARLERLVPFAPLLPGQRLAVAAVSYAGTLQLGLNDGWSKRSQGELFARSLDAALDELCATRPALAPARPAGPARGQAAPALALRAEGAAAQAV